MHMVLKLNSKGCPAVIDNIQVVKLCALKHRDCRESCVFFCHWMSTHELGHMLRMSICNDLDV